MGMRALLDTLCHQHRAAEGLVREIDEALASKPWSEIADRLKRLRSALQGHIALEESQFYPAFDSREATASLPGVSDTAHLFATNMRVIAQGLDRFFAQHGGPARRPGFERDWEALKQTRLRRISDEETWLHPLYERVERVARAS